MNGWRSSGESACTLADVDGIDGREVDEDFAWHGAEVVASTMGARVPRITCSSPGGKASTTDGSSPVGRTSLIAGTASSAIPGSCLSVTSDGRNSLSRNRCVGRRGRRH